jgi:hypothetical protein
VATAAAVAGTLLLTGCGSLGADEVQSVASAFAADDVPARCDLLAPSTLASLTQDAPTCEAAIQDLPLGSGHVVSVEVWGEEAQAKLADDTLFLTRTADGWRVMAAACTPQGAERPYDCQLEG